MVYDRTGVIPGGADPVSDQQRSAEIGVEIRFFFETYAGSEEEREDIIKSYEKSKGNFSKMVKELLLFDNSKEGEVQRLRTVVVQLLKDGKVKETPKWVETSSEKGIKKLEKSMAAEREEAEQQLKEMNLSSTAGDDGLGALAALIQARNKEAHSSMVDDLEARYCKPKSAKRGREDEKEGTKNKKRRN
ncbi:DnaJ like protein subfamily C member 9 [Angomonas deanei]|uniref:DNAJC9 HTH domain-containing protein n=1 Tax=Angomonas deanei TaxID=59799 RepID=A0A7G2BZX2_9TRYP|nr:DnaJ like protein subfamily C member 9 [Angomonas deanei]CAD2213010.1 hypothetical protein, conserved [Angomonas deanei]|eukprot:EPY40167.1 DnaJ like protein subfamily C member 9 [Angomonas deanei]